VRAARSCRRGARCGDGEGAAEEVDVADADGGRLTEAQAGEAAQPDEGAEGSVGGLEDRADLGGCRQRHGGGRAAPAGQGDALARVARDHPVGDGAAQDGADVAGPVCTVPGARPRLTMLLTQCSTCERRRDRIRTSAKVVDRAARLIAVSVPGAHTWRADHSA
jgi:hypothetical protein